MFVLLSLFYVLWRTCSAYRLNTSGITAKFRISAMFVMANIKIIPPMQCVAIFVVCLRTKLHMLDPVLHYSPPTKWKHFQTVDTLLAYVLQNYYLKISHIFPIHIIKVCKSPTTLILVATSRIAVHVNRLVCVNSYVSAPRTRADTLGKGGWGGWHRHWTSLLVGIYEYTKSVFTLANLLTLKMEALRSSEPSQNLTTTPSRNTKRNPSLDQQSQWEPENLFSICFQVVLCYKLTLERK